MKTIEEKRQELKNNRIIIWFTDVNKITFEETSRFISVDDLTDLEIWSIFSNIMFGFKSGLMMTVERNSAFNWEIRK